MSDLDEEIAVRMDDMARRFDHLFLHGIEECPGEGCLACLMRSPAVMRRLDDAVARELRDLRLPPP